MQNFSAAPALSCKCAPGYAGADCQRNVQCPEPFGLDEAKACSGHGACQDGRCSCAEGWGGPNCLDRTCPTPASLLPLAQRALLKQAVAAAAISAASQQATSEPSANETSSVNQTTRPASGSHHSWTDKPCGGRGRCGEDGRCNCEEAWRGVACETRAGCSGPELNDCSGHGECAGPGVCKCDAEWNVSADCSIAACPVVFLNSAATAAADGGASASASASRARTSEVVTAAVHSVAHAFASVARQFATPFPRHARRSGASSTPVLLMNILDGGTLMVCGGAQRGVCDADRRMCRCLPGFAGHACQSACQPLPPPATRNNQQHLSNMSASTLCVWDPEAETRAAAAAGAGTPTIAAPVLLEASSPARSTPTSRAATIRRRARAVCEQLEAVVGTVVELPDMQASRVCGRGLSGPGCSAVARYTPNTTSVAELARARLQDPVPPPNPVVGALAIKRDHTRTVPPAFQEFPCPNNCNHHGDCSAIYSRPPRGTEFGSGRLFLGVQCRCYPGYAGRDCSSLNGCAIGGGAAPGFDTAKSSALAAATSGDAVPCAGHGRCDKGHCLCDPGYSGDICADQTGCPLDCSNTPLLLAAGLRHTCLHGKCFCAPGYTGAACEHVDAGVCPSSCSGHGVCFNGWCACEPNFAGADCASLSPLAASMVAASCEGRDGAGSCSGHGTCSFGRCVCSQGWTGPRCASHRTFGAPTDCPLSCSGRGACMLGICFCDEGFTGDACDQRIGCDGRTRPVVSSPATTAVATVAAATGGSPTVVDLTFTEDCSGHGACVAGRCYCDKLHQGQFCEDKLTCPLNCSSRGICLRGNKCLCLPGFGGPACSQLTDGGVLRDKVCPRNCSGHGACVLGSCVCDKFFSGADCGARAQPKCAAGCTDHGRCVNGLCVCEPGFDGPTCEHVVPCPYDCHGRGVCHRGSCFCNPGFAGVSCGATAVSAAASDPDATTSATGGPKDLSMGALEAYAAENLATQRGCQNACSGHGLCVGADSSSSSSQSGTDGQTKSTAAASSGRSSGGGEHRPSCLCEPGYGGSMCQYATVGSGACPSGCSGHGLCDIGVCRCYPGYMGLACGALDVGAFSRTSNNTLGLVCPDDCSGHGTCQFGRRCACDRGYGGPNCGDATLNPAVLAIGELSSRATSTAGARLASLTGGASIGSEPATLSRCPRACSSYGVCAWSAQRQRHLCVCKTGFSGPACSQWGEMPCTESATVQRHGRSSDLAAVTPDTLPCSGSGICLNGTCACDAG